MTAPHQSIRRRANGTIDTDVYRRQADAERAEAVTAFLKGLRRFIRPLPTPAIFVWPLGVGRQERVMTRLMPSLLGHVVAVSLVGSFLLASGVFGG